VRTDIEIRFYRALPRIDVRLILTFDEAAIGNFFDDDTKLNVYWPLGFDGEIHHDIAFGAVRTRPGRPFFPVSWVDVSDGKRGLGYFTRGTQRHRVNGRTLANVIAWGDDTDRIGNRADSTPRPWPKSFDQRLRGSHVIEYALYPHGGSWVEAGVVPAARSFTTPLCAVRTARHDGRHPSELAALTVGPESIVVTAVLPDEDGIRLRMYNSTAGETRPEVRSTLLTLHDLASLEGRPIAALGPFRVGHATLVSSDASP
jgi:alpha-mannosidase